MRIAQVVPRGEKPWSGILTVIVQLSAALRSQGNDVEVWQLHDWRSPGYGDHHRLLDASAVHRLPVAVEAPWWTVGRAVRVAVEKRDIAVVHLHGAFNVWNTLVSRALPCPYVFSPHSGYDPVSLRRSRIRKAVYGRLFERRMLRRAALSVALTAPELSQLRAFGARGPSEVIPNGVHPPPDNLEPLSFRSSLSIPPRTPLAVFVGRLDVFRKGLDILTRGIARTPDWHLALVGPRFRGMENLEALIRELGVGDRVHLAGELHGRGLHEAFAAADVFVLLSRWEGLPMVLLEALSHGKPAIVSPAVERLVGIEAAGAGWVADDDTLPGLLRDLQRAGRDEVRRWREAAWIVARRYDWASVARRYMKAYERARRSDNIVES
jgi:glycosyltransferase involved in cell wall biosynthesis